MSRSDLINKVKTRIDEVSKSGDTIVDVGIENTKPYDTIVDELLDESALEVLLKAPFFRLPITAMTTPASGTPDTNDAKIGTISLPADFLRLVSFKMKEWLKPVTTFALPGDDIAVKQSNKYIRGGVAKPVAILRKTSTGHLVSYYSINSSHQIGEFLYIKKSKAENITDDLLIETMCWICAGKTLTVLGQINLANQCYENAKGLMV